MLSTSNISYIFSDTGFVICTYKFHFFLCSTHCSLPAKLEDTQPSSFPFSLLSLFLGFLPHVWVNTFFGWFSYCVLPLYFKSHNIFVFIANVPYWDSWQYVLTLTIKDCLFKGISTQSDPSFTKTRDISFENPSIGNKYNQSFLQSRNYCSLLPTKNKTHSAKVTAGVSMIITG